MTSALGGFATGLTQGMEARSKYARNRRIDALLDQEQSKALSADVGLYEEHLREGGDPEGWIFQQEQQDPFLIRQFQKLKSKFSGEPMEEPADPYAVARERIASKSEPQAPRSVSSAIPRTPRSMSSELTPGGNDLKALGREGFQRQYGIPQMADGGKVDEDDDAAEIALGSLGAYVGSPRVRRGVYKAGRAISGALGRAGGVAAAGAKRFTPVAAPIAAGVAIGQQLDSDYDERIAKRFGFVEPTAGEEPSVAGFAKFFGKRLLGFASDVGDTLTFGQAGKLYRDKQEEQAQSALPQTQNVPDERAPKPTAIPADRAAAVEASIGGGTAPEVSADKAVTTAIETVKGHPQHPDQQFDFSTMAAEGFSPEEIPHVSVPDWNEYRKGHVLAGLKQGRSVTESNAEVDALQHAGFLRNFEQAAYLNMAGDTKGAALAARAAYQYFPNGSDIRFTSMVGKDGKEYLVGMGYDEKTGEMVGQPQVMNEGYVNAMLANFSNPQAFNTWKADQDEAFRLEKEYEEVSKPAAQADLNLKTAQTDYYHSGAQKNRAGAVGQVGPERPSEANIIAAGKTFEERVQFLRLKDDRLADRLAALMSRLYANGEGTNSEIIDYVMALHEQGGEDALNQFVQSFGTEG